MSKGKKIKGGSRKKNPPPTAEPTARKAAPILKGAPVTALDPFYRKFFLFSVLGILLITALLSLGSGINGDDEYQNDYSEKLVDFYATAGADTSALYIEKGNMHNYGGFFDLATGLANRALGFDEFDQGYHRVRHIFNAIIGVLAMLFVGLLAREIAGWRAAILALWLIFLSPRFLGHSLMNPKDIPFAAGFAVALYYMVLTLKAMPRPNWKHLLGLALGIALALSTRAGGLLLIAYLGLFAGIDFLMKYGFKGLFKESAALASYAGSCLAVTVGGYLLAVLFWPAALVDPLGHPFEALSEFSKLGVKIRLLFMGDNVLSDNTVWYYPLIWIFKTVPLYTIIGFLGSLLLLPAMLRRYDALPVLLCYFAAIFPAAYIIYKDSILHDGWRHLMFIYPAMIIITALFWITLEQLFKEQMIAKYAVWAILGLTMLEAAVFIIRNPRIPYVYFNPIGGGLNGAFGYYETDYWGVSVKQAIDWMEEEGIISPDMQDTVTIASTFYYNLSRQTRKRFNGKLKADYVRFNSRYDKEWDYGLFPSRFFRGQHLQSGNWPNSKSIHSIKANGVPLLAIEENEHDYAFRGQQAVKAGDWEEAARQFQLEVQEHPDNELAWAGLANAYLNLKRFDDALQAAQESLRIAPGVETSLLYEGLAYLNKGESSKAFDSMQRAIQVNEEYYIGYYYSALIKEQQKDLVAAFEFAQKAIDASPRFKPAYELAARILSALGDQENAARYLKAAQGL